MGAWRRCARRHALFLHLASYISLPALAARRATAVRFLLIAIVMLDPVGQIARLVAALRRHVQMRIRVDEALVAAAVARIRVIHVALFVLVEHAVAVLLVDADVLFGNCRNPSCSPVPRA